MIRNLQIRTRRWITLLAALLIAVAFVIALLFLIGAGYVEWHAVQDDDTNDASVDSCVKPFTTASNADVVERRPITKSQYSTAISQRRAA